VIFSSECCIKVSSDYVERQREGWESCPKRTLLGVFSRSIYIADIDLGGVWWCDRDVEDAVVI